MYVLVHKKNLSWIYVQLYSWLNHGWFQRFRHYCTLRFAHTMTMEVRRRRRENRRNLYTRAAWARLKKKRGKEQNFPGAPCSMCSSKERSLLVCSFQILPRGWRAPHYKMHLQKCFKHTGGGQEERNRFSPLLAPIFHPIRPEFSLAMLEALIDIVTPSHF